VLLPPDRLVSKRVSLPFFSSSTSSLRFRSFAFSGFSWDLRVSSSLYSVHSFRSFFNHTMSVCPYLERTLFTTISFVAIEFESCNFWLHLISLVGSAALSLLRCASVGVAVLPPGTIIVVVVVVARLGLAAEQSSTLFLRGRLGPSASSSLLLTTHCTFGSLDFPHRLHLHVSIPSRSVRRLRQGNFDSMQQMLGTRYGLDVLLLPETSEAGT
jgi:hypothetical protein